MNKCKQNHGITLVALVVTIIILSILAGITVQTLLGENSIISAAQNTAEKANQVMYTQQAEINKMVAEMEEWKTEWNQEADDNITGGGSQGGLENTTTGETPDDTPDITPPTVNIIVSNVTYTSITIEVQASDQSGLDTYKYYLDYEEEPRKTSKDNTYTYTNLIAGETYLLTVKVKDMAGNEATQKIYQKVNEVEQIPTTIAESRPDPNQDGITLKDTIKITDDLGNQVVIPGEFHIDKDSGTKVEEGIVIEDIAGNQFVWVPTGTYKVTGGTTKTNKLSRRTFTSTKATNVSGDNAIDGFIYGEGNNRSIAKATIADFLASATSVDQGGNGGFYIGRYEQGEGNVCKAGVTPYGNISRNQARVKASEMYRYNTNVTCELISSYAWDTALNFMCQNNPAGYKIATSIDNTDYGNLWSGIKSKTGEYAADCYCNIHDLLGNCVEWTTEYADARNEELDVDFNEVWRGGLYFDRPNNVREEYAAFRGYEVNGVSDEYMSFRVQMYVNMDS